MAGGVNGLVVVCMLLDGAVPSYIALGALACRRRIQDQVAKAAIAPSITTPTTAPPTIAVVLDFGGETEEVGTGEDIPVVEAGSVVNASAVTVDCGLIAVDSEASGKR